MLSGMKSKHIKILFVLLFLISGWQIPKAGAWGFYSHKLINKMAVFTLPPGMISFFKKHIDYLQEHAIDPDKRSHGVVGEAEKHYIDIDHYGEKPFNIVPEKWKNAVIKFTEDTLKLYGINPWWIEKMTWKLTQAFKDEDMNLILYYAANFGHYIADAHVPLHTTEYYDGRIPEQKGIHAFWETRIPELYSDKYNFWVGRAEYIDSIQNKAWKLIKFSHAQIDTIFRVEEDMRANFPADKMYVVEYRGTMMKKQFSVEYCDEFNKRTNNMVEHDMRRAILAVGSFWYTCWVNAGQPDLSRLENREVTKKQKEEMKETERMWKTGKPLGRPNPEEPGE
jgi:hypothetical protein